LKPHENSQEVLLKDAALQARLRRTGFVILVAGLLAAGIVYKRTAPGKDGGAYGYVVEGGVSYAIPPANSKQYNYQMETLEGKEGILGAEIMDWFNGLWHGRKLASTLLVLSVAGSAGCFFLSHLLLVYPPLPVESGGPKNDSSPKH
jgi:hypothetical protein